MKTRLRKRLEFLAGVYGPSMARLVFPSLIWRVDTNGAPVVYLTFDDGPTPHLTPRLLDTLARHEASATFFLLGKEKSVGYGIANNETCQNDSSCNNRFPTFE